MRLPKVLTCIYRFLNNIDHSRIFHRVEREALIRPWYLNMISSQEQLKIMRHILFLYPIIVNSVCGLPNFHVSLFFSSLQKDSSLPPQSGEYLKDSFRTEVLAPFATAIVDGFGKLDKRVVQLENTNLLFRILFGTGI